MHLVQEIYDHFILLYSKTIEMLSNGVGQLLFALSASILSARHRWRQLADATRENEFVVRTAEGRRRVEAVGMPVYMQN